MMFGRRPITVKAAEEDLRGGAPDGSGILSDDCDPRLQQIGQQDVVEADRRDAPVKPKVSKRAKCPDGTRFCPVNSAVGGSGRPSSSIVAVSALSMPSGRAGPVFRRPRSFERLGSDQFLYGTVGGAQMTARVDPRLNVALGDRVKLGLDTRNLHFFEAESELALL
jgi:hypothetical protein